MAVVMCSGIVSKILLLVTLFDALYWINALDGCDRDDAAVTSAGRSCQRSCSHDRPCRNAIRECRCDGICGMSCLKPSMPTPMSTRYSECGVSRYGVPPGLEENKVPAAEGAWPWQVYLEIHYTEDPFSYEICGGTVLRNDTILTAANCVMNFSFLDAFMGITSRIRKGREYQHRRLTSSDVTIHSRFDNFTFSHNIALIHLNQSITLTQNVRAACLPDPERAATLLYKRSAIVTGWGHDDIVDVGDGVPDGGFQPVDHLQQLPLPLKSREICEDSLLNDPEAAWWDETMICAGYTTKRFGVCVGDSGGPLIKYANSGGTRRWTIIGITSWGRGCAALNELDFFTNVPYFVGWINEKMNSFQNN